MLNWFRERVTRRRLAIWAALGILLPVLWGISRLTGRPDSLVVSPETTYITQPTTDDGYVDFASVYFGELREAGSPRVADDPWIELSRSHDMVQGEVWPLPDRTVYHDPGRALVEQQVPDCGSVAYWASRQGFAENRLFDLTHAPWSADQSPVVARAIRQNDAWYDQVKASYRPLSPFSTDGADGFYDVEQPGRTINRHFITDFLLRAANHFGEHRLNDGLADIAFAYQIAARDRLLDPSMPMVNESRAARLVMVAILSARRLTPETMRLVARLPTESTRDETIVILERIRLAQLDSTQRAHQGKESELDYDDKWGRRRPELYADLRSRWLRINIDWNLVMRLQNQRFEVLREAFTESDPARALQEIKRLHRRWDVLGARRRVQAANVWDDLPAETDVVWQVCSMTYDAQYRYQYMLRLHTRRKAVQIVARLAWWKQQHGRFPTSLNQLGTIEQLPDAAGDLFVDPFTGLPFVYESSDSGFELRSLEANGKRDQSGVQELELSRFSRTIGRNDDLIWRWPLVESQPYIQFP